jgi:hypothetical protein
VGWQRLFSSHHHGFPSRHLQDFKKKQDQTWQNIFVVRTMQQFEKTVKAAEPFQKRTVKIIPNHNLDNVTHTDQTRNE